MSIDDIFWKDASELAINIKEKTLSPVEIIRSFLGRIDKLNPKINAFVTICHKEALAQAELAEQSVMKRKKLGPIHGVPFCVKDNTYTKGVRTTMGSKLLQNYIANEDAILVARLKKAGGIMIGKTNTPEFASIPYTDNEIFGVTRNPWNQKMAVGGSSGGTAAAVAAGFCPIGTGNDAGGSIRIPASCCGVFGLKPQLGRIPSFPIFHQWESISHEGPITRSVSDSAIMMDIMAGHHWGDRHSIPIKPNFSRSIGEYPKNIKAAWSPDLGYAKVSHEVKSLCEDAIKNFSNLGISIDPATPEIGNVEDTYLTIINAELGAMLSLFGPFEEVSKSIEPQLTKRIKPINNMTAYEYLKATFERRELSSRMGRFFTKYDILFTPTIGVTAWPIGLPNRIVEEVDGEKVSTRGWLLTYPFNLTGQPAASLPIGFSKDGLPIGIQIVGRAHEETTVLKIANAYQKEFFTTKTPPNF
jgi:Asp-tRNA(Asn)/Glu-tRNA(Gln) amidotransferase A subunit family amidase